MGWLNTRRLKVCLKRHLRLYALICGIFGPNSVRAAHRASVIQEKSPTKCDAHPAESNVQTYSGDPEDTYVRTGGILDITERNKGFSLVELLVGISIMAVVGLMITSLLGSSTRLYRSTISDSNVQTESQTVGRRISNAVMEAKSIYLYEGEPGSYLFTGERKAESGKVAYSGQIFWYNPETGCLYQNSSFWVEEDADAEEADAEDTGAEDADAEKADAEEADAEDADAEEGGGLSAAAVKAALEGGVSQGREYLISDKVKSLDFTIYPELTENERISDEGNYYKTDGKITVSYEIRFQYLDSKSHTVKSGATPRNKVEVLWQRSNDSGGGEQNQAEMNSQTRSKTPYGMRDIEARAFR